MKEDNWLVIGIIDSNDCVQSHKVSLYSDATHGDFFPPALKKWRWNFSNGFNFSWSNCFHKFNSEEMELIINHMAKEYGVKS